VPDEQDMFTDYFRPQATSNEFENYIWNPRDYFLRLIRVYIAQVLAVGELLVEKMNTFQEKLIQQEEVMDLVRHIYP
jgi:hypothetical protein